MKISILYFFLIFISLTTFSLADQCSVLSGKQVKLATRILEKQTYMYHYCQRCGDKKIEKLIVGEIVSREIDNQIKSNNKGVDIAYIYIKETGDRYINLAFLVGCKTVGVENELRDESFSSLKGAVEHLIGKYRRTGERENRAEIEIKYEDRKLLFSGFDITRNGNFLEINKSLSTEKSHGRFVESECGIQFEDVGDGEVKVVQKDLQCGGMGTNLNGRFRKIEEV